jgi:hypothetical protein
MNNNILNNKFNSGDLTFKFMKKIKKNFTTNKKK